MKDWLPQPREIVADLVSALVLLGLFFAVRQVVGIAPSIQSLAEGLGILILCALATQLVIRNTPLHRHVERSRPILPVTESGRGEDATFVTKRASNPYVRALLDKARGDEEKTARTVSKRSKGSSRLEILASGSYVTVLKEMAVRLKCSVHLSETGTVHCTVRRPDGSVDRISRQPMVGFYTNLEATYPNDFGAPPLVLGAYSFAWTQGKYEPSKTSSPILNVAYQPHEFVERSIASGGFEVVTEEMARRYREQFR